MKPSIYARDVLETAERLKQLNANDKAIEIVTKARKSVANRLDILRASNLVAMTLSERLSVSRRKQRESSDDALFKKWLSKQT